MAHQVTLPDGMPQNMAKLPRDEAGRPVPYFVQYIDGKPDFRVMDPKHFRKAIMEDRCWVCGRRMQPATTKVFVAGPMCLVNGTSAEPPSHMACAEWSARACPFLVNPKKKRREGGLPEEADTSGGIMIARNPGVTALIAARRWWTEEAMGGVIIKFASISEVRWFAEGRPATAREVAESIESGMPALTEMAKAQGPAAQLALAQMLVDAFAWLPKEAV